MAERTAVHPSELESEDFMTEVMKEGGCSHQCQPNSTQLVVKLNCCHAATASHYSQNSLRFSDLTYSSENEKRKRKQKNLKATHWSSQEETVRGGKPASLQKHSPDESTRSVVCMSLYGEFGRHLWPRNILFKIL